MKNETVMEILQRQAFHYKDRICFFDSNGESVSYEELFEFVQLFSKRYPYRQHILITPSNRLYYALAQVAAVASQSLAFFHNPSFDLEPSFKFFLMDQVIRDQEIRNLLHQVKPQNKKGREDKKTSVSFIPQTFLDQPSICLNSSGTTAAPKGILISEAGILCNMKSVLKNVQFQEDDLFYSVLPLYHIFGFLGDVLAPLYCGSQVCFGSSIYSLVEDLPKIEPTFLNVPPSMASFLRKALQESSSSQKILGSRLRNILCAGSSTSLKDKIYFHDLGVDILCVYGQSELSGAISAPMRDQVSLEEDCGKPLDCMEIFFQDGELFVRSPSQMWGWIDEKGEVFKTDFNSIHPTGDLAVLKNEHLFIKGRKDLILVFENGIKLHPEWLENILEKEVKEIEEALVMKGEKGIVCWIYSNAPASLVQNAFWNLWKQLNRELPEVESLHIIHHPPLRNEQGKKRRLT